MHVDLITQQWDEFVPLLPANEILGQIQILEDFVSEESELLLPSVVMGTKAPLLRSLIVATKNFLAEIRFGGTQKNGFHFDLVDRSLFFRIELHKGETSQVTEEGEFRLLQTINLEVTHGLHGKTTATYIAVSVDSWMSRAKAIFPPRLILASNAGPRALVLAPEQQRAHLTTRQ